MRIQFVNRWAAAGVAGFVLLLATSLQGAPPFSGTIFIDPDIITEDDPTAFVALEDAGTGRRTMYDRRPAAWVTLSPFLFNASFDDGLTIEMQVNPEFGGVEAARAEALKYAMVIGRLPTSLRRDVQTSWIHKGVNAFGGGNNNLLIHTGQGERYIRDGILEETFVHEAVHTSLDAYHKSASGWLAAQDADSEFISTYARDNRDREDIAESFLPYLAVRHRADRISTSLKRTIEQTIPNRIAYFDGLDLDYYPVVVPEKPALEATMVVDSGAGEVSLEWRSKPGVQYAVESSAALRDWSTVKDVVGGEGETTGVVISLGDTLPERLFFRVREEM